MTHYNKCGRIGMKWLFVFFFTFIEECCVVIEKNIDKKLANRISCGIVPKIVTFALEAFRSNFHFSNTLSAKDIVSPHTSGLMGFIY